MRIRLQIVPEKPPLVLPCNYNQIVQAFIYAGLDRRLSKKIHDEGAKDPETDRRLKLFTFSRLIPERSPEVKHGMINLHESVYLVVASPLGEFIESLVTTLLKEPERYLGKNRIGIGSVEVESLPPYQDSIRVRTLSPITLYSTLKTADGRRKTYYYTPFEREWSELIIENLRRKARILYNEIEDGGYIHPIKVSSRNQRIVIYKGTVIKGWDGVFELRLPEKMFFLALEAGLGAKNGQGFGCVEISSSGKPFLDSADGIS